MTPILTLQNRGVGETKLLFRTSKFLCVVQLLDNLAGQKPQLTSLELFMLSTSVAAAASGPWILGGKLTEFLAPTAAACKLRNI